MHNIPSNYCDQLGPCEDLKVALDHQPQQRKNEGEKHPDVLEESLKFLKFEVRLIGKWKAE